MRSLSAGREARKGWSERYRKEVEESFRLGWVEEIENEGGHQR